jgi:poly(hydroxyalkanoate) depolymerase family esterase
LQHSIIFVSETLVRVSALRRLLHFQDFEPMTLLSKFDMKEATRLTREGRLEEAMAILRKTLCGSSQAPLSGDGGQGPAGPTPPLLDVEPASGRIADEELSAPFAAYFSGGVAQPQMPDALRAFLDGLGQTGPAGGLQGWSSPSPRPVQPEAFDNARFEDRVYANGGGGRPYKLYVPSCYDGQALPLVVMLHGCTQSPNDFAAGTRMNDLAEEHAFLVAYPAQTQSANASKCWNWFNAGDQRRDRGEPSLIAGITREIMREFSVEPGRVYVAGLSAGGAFAAIMGATYPDLYAAVGVHSGLACGAARDMPSAFAAMRQGGPAPGAPSLRHIPTIVFHGDRDTTVNPVNGEHVIAQSKAAADFEATAIRGEAPGGIRFTRTVQTDDSGHPMLEHWLLHGVGHAWSGGSPAGSYTEPNGPDASREMIRFFMQHPKA